MTAAYAKFQGQSDSIGAVQNISQDTTLLTRYVKQTCFAVSFFANLNKFCYGAQ